MVTYDSQATLRRHVLGLASQLQLSAEQRKRTQAILESMKTQAVRLGKPVINRVQA